MSSSRLPMLVLVGAAVVIGTGYGITRGPWDAVEALLLVVIGSALHGYLHSMR